MDVAPKCLCLQRISSADAIANLSREEVKEDAEGNMHRHVSCKEGNAQQAYVSTPHPPQLEEGLSSLDLSVRLPVESASKAQTNPRWQLSEALRLVCKNASIILQR